MAENVGTIVADLNLDSKGLTTGIQKAMGKLGGLGKAFMPVAAGAAAVGAVLIGVGKAAFTAGLDFNKLMANVQSLDIGIDRIDELKVSVREMAIDTGKSTSDLTEGLYQVVSAFGDSADTAKILELNAKAAAAGIATTTDAINLTSAVTKGYGDTSAEAVAKVSDLAFQTVKLGQTTFPELAASMGKVVPVASALGVSQEELFAQMATLTGVTGSAAEVATQLRGVLAAMQKPTKEMETAMIGLGFASAEAMIQELGMVGAMEALAGETTGTSGEIAKMFGQVEATGAVLALTGGQADTFKEKLAAMGEASGATDKAFKAQTEGVNAMGHALTQAKLIWADILIVLSEQLGPAFKAIVLTIKDVVAAVREMVAGTGKVNPVIKIMKDYLTSLWDAVGPLVEALWNFLKPLLKIVGVLVAGTFLAQLKIMSVVFKVIGMVLKITLVPFINHLAKGLDTLWKGIKKAIEWAKKLPGASRLIGDFGGELEDATDEAEDLSDATDDLTDDMKQFVGPVDQAETAVKDFGGAIATAETKIEDFDTALLKQLKTDREFDAAMEDARKSVEAWRLEMEDGTIAAELEAMRKGMDNLLVPAGAIGTVIIPNFEELTGKIGAGTTAMNALDTAFKTLGITSQAEMATVVTEAEKARDAVLGSGVATDFEKKTAIYKAMKAQADFSKKIGREIPADQAQLLADMEAELTNASTGLKPSVEDPWKDTMTNVSTAITNSAQSIAGILIGTEEGSIADAFKQLGKSILSSFLEPVMKAFNDLIELGIKKVISWLTGSGDGGGGLMDAIGGIFGGGGGGGGATTPAPGGGGGGDSSWTTTGGGANPFLQAFQVGWGIGRDIGWSKKFANIEYHTKWTAKWTSEWLALVLKEQFPNLAADIDFTKQNTGLTSILVGGMSNKLLNIQDAIVGTGGGVFAVIAGHLSMIAPNMAAIVQDTGVATAKLIDIKTYAGYISTNTSMMVTRLDSIHTTLTGMRQLAPATAGNLALARGTTNITVNVGGSSATAKEIADQIAGGLRVQGMG